MHIVTSNEKNTLPNAERQADVASIFSQLPSAVVLWQEIRDDITPGAHADVRLMEPANTDHRFGNLPIPISVPPRYSVRDSFQVQIKGPTGPLEWLNGYDTGSAPRFLAGVRLQDEADSSLRQFWVLNTHMTNGCEWEKSDSDPTLTAQAKFLRPFWNMHFEVMKAKIDELKAADWTVFWGGDFNRKNMPEFGVAQKMAVGAGAIDKLVVIDRSVDSALVSTGTIATYSDHDARWARWDLSNRPT